MIKEKINSFPLLQRNFYNECVNNVNESQRQKIMVKAKMQ